MWGLNWNEFKDAILNTAAELKQPAEPFVCVPLGHKVEFNKPNAFARTTPTPESSVPKPNRKSTMKKALRTGSAIAIGVPKGANWSTMLLMKGKPPSRSALQFALERCT